MGTQPGLSCSGHLCITASPAFFQGDEVRWIIQYICFLYVGGRAYGYAYFGVGSGQIFLSDVHCSLSSNKLLECPSRLIFSRNCLHSADAGVGCEGI